MRLSGGERQIAMPDLEDDLSLWIKGLREKKTSNSAEGLFNDPFDQREEKENDFNASKGWLSKFNERNKHGVRQRITIVRLRRQNQTLPHVSGNRIKPLKLSIVLFNAF